MNKKKKNFFAIFILWNQEKTKQNQIDKKEKHKIRVFVSWKKEKISKNYHRKIKVITIYHIEGVYF